MKIFNKAIRILLATNGLILVSGAMFGPIYAIFVEKVGGDLLDASYAFAAFALAGGITTLVSGRYTDKLKDNELIIVLGYFIMGLGYFGYIFVDSIFALLIVQVIIGLGEAIYAPAFDATYSKHLCDSKCGKTWGTWESMNYFTISLGAILGGFLVTFFGFEVMFLIMGLLCISSAAYLFFLPRRVI